MPKMAEILERLFPCFKKQTEREQTRRTRNRLLKWHSKRLSLKRNGGCNNVNEPIPLSTWPGQQLRHSIEETIAEENFCLDVTHISDIEMQVENELQESCPFEMKDQYDFCMICSETDTYEAEELTRDLSKRFQLKGHLVWNSVYLGADQFTVFEDVIERSSMVVFYVTKRFTEDEFCCHIARNRLVSPVEMCGTGVIRDIPLLIDRDVILPESLRLVQKLTLQYVGAQFPKIFTDKIRFEKVERQVQREMLTDNLRLSLMRDVVKRISVR